MRVRPSASRVIAVVAVVSAASGCKKDPNAADPAADKALIAKATKIDEEMDKTRRDALVAAKDKLGPRADLGKCPHEWKPTFGTKDAYGTAANNPGLFDVPRWKKKDTAKDDPLAFLTDLHLEDGMASIHRVGIAFADEVDVKPGPRHFRMDTKEPLSGYTRGELQKYVDPSHEPVDFQLIIDKEIPAKLGTGEEKKFEPGLVVGRFYAYDHTKKEVVCAARVFALSSSDLEFSYTAQYDKNYNQTKDNKAEAGERALRGDLREQALLSVVDKVYVAGPPIAEPDSEGDAGAGDGGRGDAGRSDAGRTKQ